jgi:hypothetical protein
MQLYIEVRVDGKLMAFLPKAEADRKFKSLRHRRGIELKPKWLTDEEVAAMKAEGRRQKATA